MDVEKLFEVYTSHTYHRLGCRTIDFHCFQLVHLQEFQRREFFPSTSICVNVNLKIVSQIYFFFQFDEIDCFSSCNFSLPWNQSTPMGYVGELCFSIWVGFGYFFANGAFLLLFISMCLHHQAFYGMFRHLVEKLKRPKKNRCDAQFLCDLVRFYISKRE